MSSGIYAYWDNVKNYYVYVGKDSHIDKKSRHKDHSSPSKIDKQKINKVLQNNPNRYEYHIIMEGDYNDLQLNKMEKLCIKYFKTNKHNYPDRTVFNFTQGGDGTNGEENHNYRHDLNDDEIIDLYVNQGLSTIKIADKLNTSHATIRDRLNNNDIKLRNMSDDNNPAYRNDLDNKEIINLYVEQGLSTIEIADKLNASIFIINKRLKDNGIELRSLSELNSGKNNPGYRDDLDDNVIIDLYIHQGFSLRQIAKELNTYHSVIRRRLKNNGIEIRKYRG